MWQCYQFQRTSYCCCIKTELKVHLSEAMRFIFQSTRIFHQRSFSHSLQNLRYKEIPKVIKNDLFTLLKKKYEVDSRQLSFPWHFIKSRAELVLNTRSVILQPSLFLTLHSRSFFCYYDCQVIPACWERVNVS